MIPADEDRATRSRWRRTTFLGPLALALAACDSSSIGDRDGVEDIAAVADAVEPVDALVAENRLVTTGAVAWATFGSPLAVSGDVLVSGAPGEDLIIPEVYSGAAYVFLRDPATDQWIEHERLVPDDTTEFFDFGNALAVDGDTVAASIPTGLRNGLSQKGAVYVFGRDQGGPDQWGAVIKISDAVVDTGGDFGTSLAVAGDLLVVGAETAAGEGMVMIFERDRGGPGAWGAVATILESDVGDSGAGDELFGRAVAVDGDNLLIGAPPTVTFSSDNDGSAYLFSRDPVDRDRWAYVTRLAPADAGAENDGFGGPIALEGDTAVVGASSAEGKEGETRAGAVYVFRRDASAVDQWHQVDKITATDAVRFDDFGSAIAFEGDTLLIGAREKPVGFNPAQGAAYVFRRDAASSDIWREIEKLTASDGASNDSFGEAVALHDETGVVGAPRREGDGAPAGVHDFGAVYLYDISEPPPLTCQPATQPTDTLDDGETITTPSGFALSAPAGTLSAPVPVWIEEVAPPTDPPLSSDTPLGAYYDVGALCTVSSLPGASFELELPVPEGVDTARLAVSVLMPASFVLDGPRSGLSWDQVIGVYDAARNVYVVTVVGLATEGMTFVLVEQDIVDPVAPLAGRPARPGRDAAAGAAVTEDCDGPPVFAVQCKLSASLCPAADVAREITDAYDTYKAQGFPEPLLKREGCEFTRISVYPITHDACDRDPASDTEVRSGGRYVWAMESFRICVDPGAPFAPDQLRRIIRHELFHAVEHGFPSFHPPIPPGQPVPPGPEPDKWIVEGMAEAAIDSSFVMQRVVDPARHLREVDASMISPLGFQPYEAQDFWVHLFSSTVDGVRRAYPLAQLADFLAVGGRTENVAEVMRHPPGSRYRELGAEYWAWAKNQVVEKTDVTFGGELANPCVLETSLIDKPLKLAHPAATEVEGHFETPLQTRWVAIKFRRRADGVVIQAEGDSLAYKVYLIGDTQACTDVADGSRFFGSLPAGSEVFVLVANKSYRTVASFKVSVFAGG